MRIQHSSTYARIKARVAMLTIISMLAPSARADRGSADAGADAGSKSAGGADAHASPHSEAAGSDW